MIAFRLLLPSKECLLGAPPSPHWLRRCHSVVPKLAVLACMLLRSAVLGLVTFLLRLRFSRGDFVPPTLDEDQRVGI